jgi:cytidyltransferase-like protein
MRKKVMVSGCYDLLHSGHIRFLELAAEYGDLYVRIGTDENIRLLKGHAPKFNEAERLYIVGALKFVTEVKLSSGSGQLDFAPDLLTVKPDIFIVNEDGNSAEKRSLCTSLGIEYLVLPRTPKEGLPVRSSTAIKAGIADGKSCEVPYRLCIAGGWMDQPFISTYAPGSVVTVQIQPRADFMKRSGLATSTRKTLERLVKYHPEIDDKSELAKLLFGYENLPGTKYISGSQDAIGLTHPGVNRLDYDGGFWPVHVESCLDEDVCAWLEKHLRLVALHERPNNYDPLLNQNLTREGIQRLAMTGRMCYDAILRKDLATLGRSFTMTHDAWREILPFTTSPEIDAELNSYNHLCTGRITSGSGGGYIILATDKEIVGSFGVKVIR